MSIKIYTAQCGSVVSTTTTSYKRFSETPNSPPIKQNRKQNLSHIILLEKDKKIDTQINRNEKTGSTKSKSKTLFLDNLFPVIHSGRSKRFLLFIFFLHFGTFARCTCTQKRDGMVRRWNCPLSLIWQQQQQQCPTLKRGAGSNCQSLLAIVFH